MSSFHPSCPIDEVSDNPSHPIEHLILTVQKLSLARDLETVMYIVKHAARKLTQSDGATFILRDGSNCFYADEDAIAPLWKGMRFPLDICIGGWTMNNRQPAIIPNVLGDSRIPYEAYKPTFVKSLLTAPIRRLDPIGAIGIYWSQYHESTPEEIKLLQALADSTAIAMENIQVYSELEKLVKERTAELELANQNLVEEISYRQQAEKEVRQLSLTDELTQLSNRRGFNLLGEHELDIARRHHYYCTLFFIDLDGLKLVNDTYGHEIGDQMIKDAANLFKQTFRDVDIIARLGGDEFVILTAAEVIFDQQAVYQRLLNNLAKFNQQSNQPYQLSFSVGQVKYSPESSDSLESLLTQGDQAMYLQKKGKHRYH
ncbi:sensor domain-containing diguanylate cyclase [Aphanothece sacrum]|uniref:Diguanylate cyclase, GAF domain protein n=1 Tax=Aphanothece sacrum FPU1 TaxID=1920663 RepID=A0A401INR1_APHSA|nr:sensor domain-containing diguanylate cyclase [Aphanothece sacrum]GBF82882.1 diguanylate cyclase, GAF domain protein [Aphanothece sacrum FPU1]GBF85984.1 diguanylate cyclase [Aphanothece sacrum FPU3]